MRSCEKTPLHTRIPLLNACSVKTNKIPLSLTFRMSDQPFVVFAESTLPLDGGECLYLMQELNQHLSRQNTQAAGHSLVMVTSILPAVEDTFRIGFQSPGKSRALKITCTSLSGVRSLRRWTDRNMIHKNGSLIRLRLSDDPYPSSG